MLHGRLSHIDLEFCSRTDALYPRVLIQPSNPLYGGLIQRLCLNLGGVPDSPDVHERNRARLERHFLELTTFFALSSPSLSRDTLISHCLFIGDVGQHNVATTHLISGLPCSGKTTYASAVRADIDSALFSLDRWLITSFGRYSIADIGHEEHVRRVLACRALTWEAASELLRRGVDVILDDGFFLRENRVRVVELSRGLGATAKIHFLDTPLSVLRTRLEARNAKLPPYNFRVGADMLQAFAGLFEVPSDDEGAGLVIVRDVHLTRTGFGDT